MNAQLSAAECDFLLDLIDSCRDGKVERAARYNKINPDIAIRSINVNFSIIALYSAIRKKSSGGIILSLI